MGINVAMDFLWGFLLVERKAYFGPDMPNWNYDYHLSRKNEVPGD